MKKIMDIETNPKIRTYQYNAYVESIIPCHKNYEDWINGNYIQTVVFTEVDKANILLDYFVGNIFGQIPLLKYSKIEDKDTFKDDSEKVHEVMQNAIEDGYYVYTFLDEFYVPNRSNTNTEHKVHDVLVYGYDSDEKVYMIVGYDREGRYSSQAISYELFAKAFNNDNPCISLLCINNNEYKFDINLYKEMVLEYLNSVDSREKKEMYYDVTTYNPAFFDNRLKMQSVFGLNGMRVIPMILDVCKERDFPIDYKVFYLMEEHKTRMLDSFLYLKKRGYVEDIQGLYDAYKKIKDESALNTRLGIKYSLIKSQSTLNRIKESIYKQCEQEAQVLDQLVSLIGR